MVYTRFVPPAAAAATGRTAAPQQNRSDLSTKDRYRTAQPKAKLQDLTKDGEPEHGDGFSLVNIYLLPDWSNQCGS